MLKLIALSLLLSMGMLCVVEDHLRNLAATIPLAANSTAAQLITTPISNASTFDHLKGLMQGAGSGILFDDLNSTLFNTTALGPNITSSLSNFQGKNSSQIALALNTVGYTFKAIYQVALLSNLTLSNEDLALLKKMSSVLRSITNTTMTFTPNVSLVVYGSNVSLLMSHGLDFPALTYIQAGRRFGQITGMITFDGNYNASNIPARRLAVLPSTTTTTTTNSTTLNATTATRPGTKGWNATNYTRFNNMTKFEKKTTLTGTGLSRRQRYATFNSSLIRVKSGAVPSAYDLRSITPQCVHPVQDQGSCGACWAFAATEVLSDRLCIASPANNINVQLSAQNLINCDYTDMGCMGGYLDAPWTFLENSGAPTTTCQPYTSSLGVVGTCSAKCADNTAATNYFAVQGSSRLFSDPASIKAEILAYGPVEASMSVFEDFFSYANGIYVYQWGDYQGGHAVKIVGWGTDSVMGNYWICQNSWGLSWGENGFFRIQEGQVGIDSAAIAGLPSVPPPPPPPPTVCPACPACPSCGNCNCYQQCFSGEMTVNRFKDDTVEVVKMKDLSAGDLIQVNDGSFEPVLAFFQHHKLSATTLSLSTVNDHGKDAAVIELTPHHYVFAIRDGETLHIPSNQVRQGDKLKRRNRDGSHELLTISRIAQRDEVVGHYNPMTPSKTLLVNGVQSSNYVENSWDKLNDILMLFGRIHPSLAQMIIRIEKLLGLQAY